MTDCRVEVCPDPFDPWQQLALWSGDAAAAAIFMGRVRPSTMDGRPLEALELEHFPGLCERQITAMAQRLQRQGLAPVRWLGQDEPGSGGRRIRNNRLKQLGYQLQHPRLDQSGVLAASQVP